MTYTREVTVEKALVKETEERGGIAYKLTVPGRSNVPDRLLLMPGGRAIFVECKAPGRIARPAQRRELERLAELGFETHVLSTSVCAHIFEKAAPPPPPPKPPRKPRPKQVCYKSGCERQAYAGRMCLRHWRELKENEV